MDRTVVSERRLLIAVIAAGIAARLLYVFLFVDVHRDSYWEYGDIVKNLHAGKGYSLYYAGLSGRTGQFDLSANPVASAYMAPGYVLFLFPFFFISDIFLRNVSVLVFQALGGGASVGVMWLLTKRFFSARAALPAALIVALLPEFVYAAGTFTPTTAYHLLVVMLLFSLYAAVADRGLRWVVFAGILTGVIMLTRTEFSVFALLAAVLLFRKRGASPAALFTLLALLVYSPWVIRNAVAFERFVPFTTGGGVNLFRGHNALEHGAWADSAVAAAVTVTPIDRQHEIAVNGIFLRRALTFMHDHPLQDAGSIPAKLLYLWGFNPAEERAMHPLYLVPWALLLCCAAAGAAASRPLMRHLPVLLFLVHSTVIAAAFFVLPRYQTMMKIALVPFAAMGILLLLRRLRPVSH